MSEVNNLPGGHGGMLIPKRTLTITDSNDKGKN